MPIIQHIELARKIATRITTDAPITYSTLEARAAEKGINPNLFQQAMAIIHRSKTIECKTKGDEIVYTIKVVKEPVKLSGAEWVTRNYPQMDSSNDGSGIDADFSYLFLSPEEMDKYRAEAAGRSYIPKKRYAIKNT